MVDPRARGTLPPNTAPRGEREAAGDRPGGGPPSDRPPGNGPPSSRSSERGSDGPGRSDLMSNDKNGDGKVSKSEAPERMQRFFRLHRHRTKMDSSTSRRRVRPLHDARVEDEATEQGRVVAKVRLMTLVADRHAVLVAVGRQCVVPVMIQEEDANAPSRALCQSRYLSYCIAIGRFRRTLVDRRISRCVTIPEDSAARLQELAAS